MCVLCACACACVHMCGCMCVVLCACACVHMCGCMCVVLCACVLYCVHVYCIVCMCMCAYVWVQVCCVVYCFHPLPDVSNWLGSMSGNLTHSSEATMLMYKHVHVCRTTSLVTYMYVEPLLWSLTCM